MRKIWRKNKFVLAFIVSVIFTAFVVKAGVCLPVYFGKGSQEKYFLVNTQTGKINSFLPAGYRVINQWEYQMFPAFLILQKDNDLYSYNVENKFINSILGPYKGLKLKKNEKARIYASITEKDKFIISINSLDLSKVSDLDGSSPILSTRTYSFNATTNKLVSLGNISFDARQEYAVYDSKNQRFFTWPGGEGIGSVGPLSISDLKGHVQSQVITAQDIGLSSADDEIVRIQFNNGIFFAFNNSLSNNNGKIIVLDPKSVKPAKEIYTSTEQVKSQVQMLSSISVYSMGIDKGTNTLIVGSNNDILLLRFNKNKQITQFKYIPDKGIYANFIFPNEGKLYYQAKDNIRVINLNSWQIEKSIPSSGQFSEITLFDFK